MPDRLLPMDERLYRYLLRETVREPAVMARLRAETEKLPGAGMQIGPEQGQFMGLLVRLIIARRFWREAGVADRIELRLAPAADTLEKLRAAGEDGRFDFAFIDADKGNYDLYYERCLKLVRPGGLIAIDNALWYGAVADPAQRDKDTRAIRALNRKIRDDARVDMALLPIGDGLLLARPR